MSSVGALSASTKSYHDRCTKEGVYERRERKRRVWMRGEKGRGECGCVERKEEESVDERREGIEESVDERRKRKRREGKRRMWMRREKGRGLGRVILLLRQMSFLQKSQVAVSYRNISGRF